MLLSFNEGNCFDGEFGLSSKKAVYEYPYSKKWVLVSCILVAVSLLFTFLAVILLGIDPISVLLFLAYTSIFATIFFLLKFRLYTMKTREELESRFTQEEETPKRHLLILLLILIASVFLPFSLLLILDPINWFMSITGFIAGINIPEIVLYLYFKRTKGKK